MWRLIFAWIIFGGFLPIYAQENLPSAPDLQKIILSSVERYSKAFADQDAKAVSELFTAEAEYVNAAGMVFHGKSTIAAEFSASFELSSKGKIEIEVLSIRPVAAGVIIEEGASTFSTTEDGPTSVTRYVATHVQQDDGSWLIASVRELKSGLMSPHDRLLSLSWILGKWHEDVRGSQAATEWKWSENKNFLIGNFVEISSIDSSLSGTHRIGWDVERSQFHSWIFASQGTSSEGWWQANQDGSWSLNLQGIDIEGIRHSSRMTYQQDGEDALIITQSDRIVNGVRLPTIMHRAVRQPPEVKLSTTNE